ncbi:MAG: DUF126 domain-containing protein [Anaerolineae bacterium]
MTTHTFPITPLVPGTASGTPLILDQPLSLWGGLDPATGEITDRRHPQSGQIVTGKILVLPSGRGSSSASSILLEAVKAKTAPAAIIMAEADGILALGAVVAQEVYAQALPVCVLLETDYQSLLSLIHSTPSPNIQIDQSLSITNDQRTTENI